LNSTAEKIANPKIQRRETLKKNSRKLKLSPLPHVATKSEENPRSEETARPKRRETNSN
jgi:hypothetical protein